jgi:hypothetical protein
MLSVDHSELTKPREERREDGSNLSLPEEHPLADSAGSFKDDPLWDEMMMAVQSHRRELDAEFDAPGIRPWH